MSYKKTYLYEEIYDHLKHLIEKDVLDENDLMPSKRKLAEQFKVSPLTVEKAYMQLIEEGYVYSVEKRGYFVGKKVTLFKPTPNKKNFNLQEKEKTTYTYDFSTSYVDTEHFPNQVWAKLAREVLSEQHHQMLNDVDPMGLYDLRVEIAKHIDIYRGIEIDPKQILIGSSSTQLLSIVIELLGRSQRYAIEDPAYPKIYHVLNTLDIKVDMIGVDQNGLIVDELKKTNVNVVHVVPSHQYPLGVTMSIQRKKELLNWVYAKKGRYIIEDDYDSEFKYQGKPIEAIKGLDALDKVIYMNTFSKSLAPSFRVAYVVLPKILLNTFDQVSMYHRCTVPSFEQYILYKFMHKGSFTRHLHRMMKIYKQKLDMVLNIMKDEKEIKISGYESGLHFILSFKSNMSEDDIIKKLKSNGINVFGVKSYIHTKFNHDDEIHLVVGYAGIALDQLEKGFKALLKVCKQYVKL